jgi:hypothetical protein
MKYLMAGLLTAIILMTGCIANPSATAVQSGLTATAILSTEDKSEKSPAAKPSASISDATPGLATNASKDISDTPPKTAVPDFTGGKIFPGTVILGRPTGDTITLSLLAPFQVELFVQYGKTAGKYDAQTGISVLGKDQPLELLITGLNKDTRYYYRICHRTGGEAGFSAGAEGTFSTQRAAGGSFIFTVDADPHFDNNVDPERLKQTFQNIFNDHPDFNIDLGDTFMTEKSAPRSYPQVANNYIDKRSYFSIFANSVPLYLAMGNHDGESGRALNGTENNMAVWASKARKLYYLNPYPDNFYSGDIKEAPFVGLRQNYYAWEWGDALFVVLDPYWYSQSGKNFTAWNMSLGQEQYNWLKTTLEKSRAKFKFVFAHNLVGGFDLGSTGNMRGGTEAAGLYEWGGQNSDGSRGFDQNRPGWGMPIQQLLADNKVTIFFHGHDHFFARQELNGVVYQECPQPGSKNDKNHADEYGYKNGTFLDGSGHIRVMVSEAQVKVDYVRTYLPGEAPSGHQNGEIAYSYTIRK